MPLFRGVFFVNEKSVENLSKSGVKCKGKTYALGSWVCSGRENRGKKQMLIEARNVADRVMSRLAVCGELSLSNIPKGY